MTTKHKTLRKFFTIIIIALLFSNCSNLDELNINPDSPINEDVIESVLLPGILTQMSYELIGGYPARASNIWSQQIALSGEGRGLSTFIIDDSDVNNTWEFSLYTGVLKNAKLLEEKAIETGNSQYNGISKIIQAYGLSIVADFWGKAPWSEAFDLEIKKPKFDTQEELYDAIDLLLKESISELDDAIAKELIVDSDILYNGNLIKWKKLANSLRARFAMRLIYAKGNTQADLALSYAKNGLTELEDEPAFDFEDKENADNPWSQWESKWTDIFISKHIIELMESKTDPRIAAYALRTADNQIIGGENGTTIQPGSTSLVSIFIDGGNLTTNEYLIKKESPITWITYSELLFITAEAYLFKNDLKSAEKALKDAVRSNITKLANNGVLLISDTAINEFIGQIILPTEFEAAQKTIIEQKYIAGFLQLEGYNDYRRTGYPDISQLFPKIPERFPYPTNEILNNTPNVPKVNYMTDKVWWDQK